MGFDGGEPNVLRPVADSRDKETDIDGQRDVASLRTMGAFLKDRIRNIVFDLGGVVVTWDPQAIVAGLFAEPAVRSAVLTGIIGHADWVSLDRGTLSVEEAIERAVKRTGLSRAQVARFFTQLPHALVPVPEMIDLLYRLKRQSSRLFCLSNMHVAAIEELDRSYTFGEVFLGRVISCRVHLCKPEPAIYRHLLKEHDLDAGETIFIDDMEANLMPAARLGIRTIPFGHPRQCEKELHALGCI